MRAHEVMLTGCDRLLIQRERVWGRQRDAQLQQQPDGDQLHISRQQHALLISVPMYRDTSKVAGVLVERR